MPRLTIGTLVDRYDMADADVKHADANLAAAKKVRQALEDTIRERFKKDDIEGATGTQTGTKLSLNSNKSPSITDRAKLNEYVRRKKAFEMFQARINKQAWLDRMEVDGKPIPGVQTYEKVTLKLTRSRN